MPHVILDIALIGLLGIGAQWVAWRTQLPAIVLLLAAGFLAGPVTGLLDPEKSFGDLLSPFVTMAVAIILFEGGLNLKLADIRETSTTVRRVILFGAPVTWGLTYLAARHVAGLSAPTAAVISGILVVTGPTVIMPLLRQSQLPRKAASLLRWEAIIADPIGALFAVIAYEGAVALTAGRSLWETGLKLAAASLLAVAFAFAGARGLAWTFTRGHVPEFLKGPVLLVAVLAGFELTNLILGEAGLLTVTLLGVALANTRLASLDELRRFNEMMTVMLVSGLFVVLTATVSFADIGRIGMADVAFLAVLLLLIRPAVIMATTTGGQLSLRERAMCAWIAPRGVVAVAVSGLFGQQMETAGYWDADRMAPLALLVVVATVVLHGFSIRPLARLLKLTASEPPGLLLVGGSAWTTALGQKAVEMGMPVLIADTNWNRLTAARRAGLQVYYGEILSEAAEHRLDLSRYGALVAATDNDAYNALVCSDLGPEMGRSNVFQIGRARTANGEERAERHQMHFSVGGRTLFKEGPDYWEMERLMARGWRFTRTKLTEEFGLADWQASRANETRLAFVVRPSGRLLMSRAADAAKLAAGDTLVAFGPPAEKAETGAAA